MPAAASVFLEAPKAPNQDSNAAKGHCNVAVTD